MKKMLILFILLFFISVPQSFAAQSEAEHTTIENVDYIYFDADSNTYYLNTVPDVSGGFWTLDLFESDKLDQDIINALNNHYMNRKISISYNGDIDNDDEIEIVSSVLINE